MNHRGLVEIDRLLDARPLSGLQLRVIALCALIVFLDGYDIQTMALAVPTIAGEWGLPPSAFGLALSATLLGIGIGAAAFAPLGDRCGRRPVLIGSLIVVGAAASGTALVENLEQLVAWRLVLGLGLGASLPNATALTSEYVPVGRRAALVTLMYCSVALGAFVAGFTAPAIIESFGWRGLFVVGGSVPLVVSVALVWMLPESVCYLVARRPGDPRIALLVDQLAPGNILTQPQIRPEQTPRASVLALLSPRYRGRTTLLWCVFCLNLFVLYLLVSWLPTLLREAGWAHAQALRGAVMIQAGGIGGGLLMSWLVDRGFTRHAMLTGYVAAALALALFAILPADNGSWWLLLLVLGGGTSGSQFALTALAAAFYPPAIRATGIGWANAMGRAGAVTSPIVGGWVIQQGVGSIAILGLLIVPVIACAGVVLLVQRNWSRS